MQSLGRFVLFSVSCVHRCLSKVLRYYHARVAAAGEDVTEADTGDWKANFNKFISKGQREDQQNTAKKAKLQSGPVSRLATYDLLRALAHAVFVGTQIGMELFAKPSVLTTETVLPLLVLTIDQGPDNMAGVWFLLTCLHLCVVVLCDMAHREKNDLKNAVSEAGYQNMLDETAVMFGLDYGPWGSAGWYSLAVEAAKDMVKVMSRHDPLLEHLGFSSTEDWRSTVAESEFVRRKVPRLRASWFSWFKTARAFMAEWRVRTLVWMYIGIKLKMFKDPKEFMALAKHIKPGEAPAEAPAASSADAKPEEVPEGMKRLRAKCKNNLHIAACVGANEMRYHEVWQLIKAKEPWYFEQHVNYISMYTCVLFAFHVHPPCLFLQLFVVCTHMHARAWHDFV